MANNRFLLTAEQIARVQQKYPRFLSKWTEDEETQVKDKFSADVSVEEIADSMGRTPKSVKLKLKELGILLPQNPGRKWTKEEDTFLENLLGDDITLTEICETMGRSRSSVMTRLLKMRDSLIVADVANRLGINSPLPN